MLDLPIRCFFGVRSVRAVTRDVTLLLALVACSSTGTGLRWAVTAQVANLTTVVALLALGAVARHVAETAAGVASLLATTLLTTVSATESTTVAALLAVATLLTTETTSLLAVAGDVADLSALVALLSTSTAERTTGWAASSSTLGALARQVTSLTALVAGLLLLRVLAFARQVALFTAVVAGWVSLGWAVTGLVRRVAAVVAGATASGSSSERVHDEDGS